MVLRQEIRAVGTGSLTPFAQRNSCISQGIALDEAPEASHDIVDGRSGCIPDRLCGGQLLVTAARSALRQNCTEARLCTQLERLEGVVGIA